MPSEHKQIDFQENEKFQISDIYSSLKVFWLIYTVLHFRYFCFWHPKGSLWITLWKEKHCSHIRQFVYTCTIVYKCEIPVVTLSLSKNNQCLKFICWAKCQWYFFEDEFSFCINKWHLCPNCSVLFLLVDLIIRFKDLR